MCQIWVKMGHWTLMDRQKTGPDWAEMGRAATQSTASPLPPAPFPLQWSPMYDDSTSNHHLTFSRKFQVKRDTLLIASNSMTACTQCIVKIYEFLEKSGTDLRSKDSFWELKWIQFARYIWKAHKFADSRLDSIFKEFYIDFCKHQNKLTKKMNNLTHIA